ncbi:MAG: archaetidylserine decarboxylase [Lautropia sp.]|nr:archaetidylserine decarboxylase [Lautropia sp.]
MISLHTFIQYALPKKSLTRLAGAGARWQGGWLTQWVIRRFIRQYRVDMQEAAESDPGAYDTFNAFFTRALRPGARPLAQSRLLCPVDGTVSQLGQIVAGRIFQAKGHDYSATALLAGDTALAERFNDGQFATLYLSPRDYHRVHMPCAGQLRQMVYVPGDLFSVSPETAATIPGLFARNERVICVFDAPWGPWVLVLVGAAIVGSMATVWHGQVNPQRPGHVQRWTYSGDADPAAGAGGPEGAMVSLARGEEMGRFMLGSTVVMLFPAGAPALVPDWHPGRPVRMGEPMSGI